MSIRAIRNTYSKNSLGGELLSPEERYRIAVGEKIGDRVAAINAFDEISDVLGESLANVPSPYFMLL